MRKLPHPDACTGCSACAAACPRNIISMVPDEFGFSHPQICIEDCISCGKCEKVCPVNVRPKERPEIGCYAAYCQDETVRKDSSSGGVFTVLAQYVLNNGGVVFGAAYDKDFQVKHIMVSTVDSLGLLRGSKYSQSDIGNCFSLVRECLNQEKLVLFSGTPCQITGLYNYIGYDDKKLILVDLVCHSVPSPIAWEKYIEFRKKTDEYDAKLTAIQQRSKRTGWVNYAYSCSFQYLDGRETLIPSNEDLFMKTFTADMITRSSCASCPCRGNFHASDFTLGDYWGVEKRSLNIDVTGGVSAVIIRSDKGQEIWNGVKDQIVSVSTAYTDIVEQNPAIEVSANGHPERDRWLSEICREGFEAIAEDCKSTAHTEPTYFKRLLQKLKRTMCNHK